MMARCWSSIVKVQLQVLLSGLIALLSAKCQQLNELRWIRLLAQAVSKATMQQQQMAVQWVPYKVNSNSKGELLD